MKYPKKIRRYCRFCRKHTEQTVSETKKGERGSLKKGSLKRLAKRGKGTAGTGNKGRASRGSMSTWKRFNKKTSKKHDLRLKCSVCNKINVSSLKRAKKLEIKAKEEK